MPQHLFTLLSHLRAVDVFFSVVSFHNRYKLTTEFEFERYFLRINDNNHRINDNLYKLNDFLIESTLFKQESTIVVNMHSLSSIP